MDFANKNIKLYSCAVDIKITSVINMFGKPVLKCLRHNLFVCSELLLWSKETNKETNKQIYKNKDKVDLLSDWEQWQSKS